MNNSIFFLAICFSISAIAGEIHDAAWQGDTDKVILLLEDGHNPDDTDADGLTVSDIAVRTHNTKLFEHLKDWGIEQEKRYSQNFLTDHINVDEYFNPKDKIVFREAIVKVSNNNAQEITSSPKKRRNSMELEKEHVKKHHADPVLESSTTASSTTASTTTLGSFWDELEDIPQKPAKNSFDFFGLRNIRVAPPPFPVVATIDLNSNRLVIGPYYVVLNLVHGRFVGFTLFSLENSNAVASMAFNKRGLQMPDAVVGNYKFSIFRNTIMASDQYGRFWSIMDGSYDMLKPVAAHNHVFITDVRDKVMYIIHGTLFEHIATVDVGEGARFPTLIGKYLVVANKGDQTFTVIDISSTTR